MLPLAYIALQNHIVEIGLMAARPLCGALICFREFSSTQADPGPWPKRVGKIGQGRRGSRKRRPGSGSGLSREYGVGLIHQAFVIMRGEKDRDALDHVHQAQGALVRG